MKQIKVSCPAKINLTLEVLDKRNDGFHNLKSIMQAVSLYDYLTISVQEADRNIIELDGTSSQIPYDSRNLVYKACVKFFEKANIKNQKAVIFIEKNIPVEAGLAGGSTDAAGTFFALNELYNKPLNECTLNQLCASLGSDLNFCLGGGTAICTGRGEKIQKIPTARFDISLIKPLNFGISAKEAYTKFALLQDKTVPNNTEKLAQALCNGEFDCSYLYNSLENAVINDYPDLIEIKKRCSGSMMSGSGPTFFVCSSRINSDFDRKSFLLIENLKSIDYGISIVQ